MAILTLAHSNIIVLYFSDVNTKRVSSDDSEDRETSSHRIAYSSKQLQKQIP
jgi:hypothetical protein